MLAPLPLGYFRMSRPRIFPRERLFCFGYNTLKTWWGLCFTTTLTLLNSHKALTTSTYSWSACRRRASSLNASYDTSLYLAYQVGRYHLTRFSVNGARSGTRTHTISQRCLRPPRLPFRHLGIMHLRGCTPLPQHHGF